VDRLILSSPADVGRWIEESANIAGYRTRKQEAVDRLRKVESHATEAERKSSSLRRELGHVRERAARARTRRDLEDRRLRLREHLNGLERRRLREALAAVESESCRLRLELEEVAAERTQLSSARRRLEEELQQIGAAADSAVPGDVDETGLAERVLRIRVAGSVVRSISERLSAAGSSEWPRAAKRLDRVAGVLQDIAGAESRGRSFSARTGECLGELRRCTAELERLERDASERASALAGRDCERARLEERLAALGDATGEEAAGPDLDPERGRLELEELGRQLARIGAVDETAELREGEIVRELEELAPVLQDLASTRSQLASFIRQMEQVTSTLFRETLVRVEARFRTYCDLLFQGGDARLERSTSADDDGADLLRAEPPDVEVRVKLPRKPETSLGLLSGGERSLAGLALVLALAAGDREEGKGQGRLLILDEVDAALDEANAARLALLLRDLQHRHQILCVTHNRLTMYQASRLVGVACAASSVSSLVKVDLARAAREESAA
jgi:chromosome segregation protein